MSNTNIGTLSGIHSVSSLIGNTDPLDIISANRSVNVALPSLTQNADMQMFRGITSLSSSCASGTIPDSINIRSLAAGRVAAFTRKFGSAITNYILNLSPSKAIAQSSNLGTLGSTPVTRMGAVNDRDTSDIYRFSVGSTSDVKLTLTGLSANVDLRLIQDGNNNRIVDTGDVLSTSSFGGSTSDTINYASLAAGTYFVQAYQLNGNTNYTLSLTATPNPSFTSFSVNDASGDNTSSTVFQGGAIQLSYNLADAAASLSNVRLEALKSGSVVSTLGTWSGASLSNQLINLASFSSLTGGDYQLRVVAHMTNGREFLSASESMKVLSWSRSNGTFAGETLNYSAGLGTGAVILGRGGTDTLNLSGISRSSITSINGISLAAFNPLSGSTANQAIFKGTAFDYMTFSDGREIYFQGIENFRFSDSSTLELQVRTNDTHFGSQWNLHISDIDSAWRFTQGSSNVLLASLDTGILTAAGANGGIVDISTTRLLTDASDDDNYNDFGHGHSAISVMASTANNSSGIAGINWNSSVYVNDIYNGVSIHQAISDTINYARARNQRVVFQGGIQGEYWLKSGGTLEQLEQLIQDNADIAIFAFAAGNGGPDGNFNDPNYLTSVSGVAQLETTHNNVMSVGALQHTDTAIVNGLTNASSVDIASYSNRGSNLTLMAATDSPAIDKLGNMDFFGGTSCANPNMAGIASLVWSVNSSLTGGQLRQIVIDTAMDLGTAGRDNTFGNGLVNADAAVRRAWALQHSSALANLYSGGSLFV